MTMAAFFLPFLLDALEAVCGNRISVFRSILICSLNFLKPGNFWQRFKQNRIEASRLTCFTHAII